jgi:hypothetical protein
MTLEQPTPSSPSIGIWGPTKAGKTSYIAALKIALDSYAKGWRIWAGTTETERFLETQWSEMAQGKFPAPTDFTAPSTYNFQIYKKDTFLGTNGQYHNIFVFDAAGRFISEPDNPYGYFEKLAQCQGILLMIDPEIERNLGQPRPTESNEPYHKLLIRLLHRLRERRTGEGDLDINLAFCITKIDLDPHWEYRETPKEYLGEILGNIAMNGIMPFCKPERTGFFATSVAGRYFTPEGVSKPNTSLEGGIECIADLTKWQPYKLLDPLFWLFDRLESEKNANQKDPIKRMLRTWLREKNYKEDTGHGKS